MASGRYQFFEVHSRFLWMCKIEGLLGASGSINVLPFHFSSWRMMRYHCQQIYLE